MSDVRELLQRLADEAPSDEEVLRGFPDNVYGREPAPVRRTWLPVLAAAAAGVLVVVGVVWSMGWRDSADVSPRPPAAERPVVPDGMRLVGAEGVYLAVPEDWGLSEALCGGAAPMNSVSFFAKTDEAQTLCVEPFPSHTTVFFRKPSTDLARSLKSEPAVQQGGLLVRRTEPTVRRSSSMSALSIEALDLEIEIVGPDAGTREQILDTVAAVPEGWTTVPTDTAGNIADVTSRLEDAGLVVKVDEDVPAEWSRDILATFAFDPLPGSVIEEGSTVTIGKPPPLGCDDTQYCPPPQLNTGQWTPGDAGMQALLTGVLAFDEPTNCAYIASPGGGGHDVVWPKGWSAVDSADGPQILDEAGKVVTTAGQEISAPGGSIGPASTGDLTCSVGTGEVFHVQGEVTVIG